MEISENKLKELAEYHYLRGQRSALVQQLRNLLSELSIPYTNIDEAPENLRTITRLTVEREDTIAALRNLCDHHGDNDWNDNLHLADVVNKHLANYLYK